MLLRSQVPCFQDNRGVLVALREGWIPDQTIAQWQEKPSPLAQACTPSFSRRTYREENSDRGLKKVPSVYIMHWMDQNTLDNWHRLSAEHVESIDPTSRFPAWVAPVSRFYSEEVYRILPHVMQNAALQNATLWFKNLYEKFNSQQWVHRTVRMLSKICFLKYIVYDQFGESKLTRRGKTTRTAGETQEWGWAKSNVSTLNKQQNSACSK